MISSANVKEGTRFQVLATREDLTDENLVTLEKDQDKRRRKGKEILIPKISDTVFNVKDSNKTSNRFTSRGAASKAVIIDEPNRNRADRIKENIGLKLNRGGHSGKASLPNELGKNMMKLKQATGVELDNGAGIKVGPSRSVDQALLI